MKNKQNLLFVIALVLVATGVISASALAQEAVAAKPEKIVEAQNVKGGNLNVTASTATTATAQNAVTDTTAVTTTAPTAAATTTAETQDPKGKDKKEKVKDNKKGKVNGEEHRSTVASFVQSLLAVAESEGGIGQEVKVIAQQQNDTKDRAADLINAVEGRSKVKTFFIGTSYKNLGELRSQMVQTGNQIEQLKRLAAKAESEQSKAELQTQLQTLEREKTNIENFITQNESKFSLFGWAVKLFRK